ncbi:MAG TPA: GAF domain-containing protein [Gemmatimonadaceae bacterium]|nr:GAF domain-containing protein [Gemmatimonadaceae bacterium]
MAPRTLASLAHALSAAADLDAAFVALCEALAELERSSRLTLLRYDPRRKLLRERLAPNGNGSVDRLPVNTAFEHLPSRYRTEIARGGTFVDFGDESEQFARLLDVTDSSDGGLLALRGLTTDGTLTAVLALYESRRIFGTRVMERFGPYAAVFDLAYARFSDREARDEAVNTLEIVTQQVHGEYLRKLTALEQQLVEAQDEASRVTTEQLLALEREAEARREQARRATHKVTALEQQVAAAVDQLERAHIELHRRSETLRQKTRSLYLIDRVLTLDAATEDPRKLVDGLVALLGDDMQAQRCSIMLRSPEPAQLYLAAARGLPPDVEFGMVVRFGEGVAGKVAERREPLLVRDVAEAGSHPLLKDQYFTTGSFISFPLVYRGELLGVVNLTNRAQRGVFVEEDVERVRLLALLISVIVSLAQLPERLLEALRVR